MAQAGDRSDGIPRRYRRHRRFPLAAWQRLQNRAGRELGPLAMNGADPRGVPALRSAIARHLAQLRGIRCRLEQVIVFNSAQQALCALALLLLDRGDTVWTEDPGYPGARAAFELTGASVTPVPVDEEGMRVEIGIRRDPRARLAYAVVPQELVEPLASLRTQLDGFTPALSQMTMSLFMEEGHLSSHLRRMRAAYGTKRAELVEGLRPLAARGWVWPGNPAGLHLVVRHPEAGRGRALAGPRPQSRPLQGVSPLSTTPAGSEIGVIRYDSPSSAGQERNRPETQSAPASVLPRQRRAKAACAP